MIREIPGRFGLDGKGGEVSADGLLVIGVTLFGMKACADAEAAVIGMVAGILISLGNGGRPSTEMCESSHTFTHIL